MNEQRIVRSGFRFQGHELQLIVNLDVKKKKLLHYNQRDLTNYSVYKNRPERESNLNSERARTVVFLNENLDYVLTWSRKIPLAK